MFRYVAEDTAHARAIEVVFATMIADPAGNSYALWGSRRFEDSSRGLSFAGRSAEAPMLLSLAIVNAEIKECTLDTLTIRAIMVTDSGNVSVWFCKLSIAYLKYAV